MDWFFKGLADLLLKVTSLFLCSLVITFFQNDDPEIFWQAVAAGHLVLIIFYSLIAFVFDPFVEAYDKK